MTYEKALPSVWATIAAVDPDDRAGEVMRTLVTAWTAADDELADYVNESGLASTVPLHELVMHFLGASVMLATYFTESIGEPFSYATDAWWPMLETCP